MKNGFHIGIALSLLTLAANAQINITNYNVTYIQDFNLLAISGTSNSLPAGWSISETGTSALVDGMYSAGTGTSTTGDTYSFGSSGSTERALGSLLSGSISSTIGAVFQNNGGETILSISVAYQGEQWRLGSTGRADRLDFQYSLDATSLTTGAWVDFDTLDFSSPNTVVAGALNGNATGNFTTFAPANIPALNIAPGASMWIRWIEFNASSNDDGLAIDDIAVTFVATPEPTAGLAILAGAAMVVGIIRQRK